MIIDAHQHLVGGPQMGQYQVSLLNGRGFHGKGHPGFTNEMVANWKHGGKTHIQLLDEVGTDMAFLSPRLQGRPFCRSSILAPSNSYECIQGLRRSHILPDHCPATPSPARQAPTLPCPR